MPIGKTVIFCINNRMKNILVFCFFAGVLSFPAVGQQGGGEVFAPETAHPRARALMKDDFFWSPIDESGPFGGKFNYLKINRKNLLAAALRIKNP
jgi:hypothetical protein